MVKIFFDWFIKLRKPLEGYYMVSVSSCWHWVIVSKWRSWASAGLVTVPIYTPSCTRACAPLAWLINYAPLELLIRIRSEAYIAEGISSIIFEISLDLFGAFQLFRRRRISIFLSYFYFLPYLRHGEDTLKPFSTELKSLQDKYFAEGVFQYISIVFLLSSIPIAWIGVLISFFYQA